MQCWRCSHKSPLPPGLSPGHLVQGVQLAMGSAQEAYRSAGAAEAVQLWVEEGVGHECTPAMWRAAGEWMDTHLRPGE